MNSNSIKKLLQNNIIIYNWFRFFHRKMKCRPMYIKKKGGVKLIVNNSGFNNKFFAGNNCLIEKLKLHIIGNDNSILIGDNVRMAKGSTLRIEGNHCTIQIMNNCTFNYAVCIQADEDNSSVIIGNDCMFSNHIMIRTSDNHPIYDAQNGHRLNNPKSVIIGDHVWIAAHATVLKGVHIESGSVVGMNSVVTHNVPPNCIVAGIPAIVVREGIRWERTFNND